MFSFLIVNKFKQLINIIIIFLSILSSQLKKIKAKKIFMRPIYLKDKVNGQILTDS